MANLLVYFFASFLTQNGPQLLTTGFKGDGFRSEKYQFCHQQAHKMWNTLFAGDLKLSHFVILLSMLTKGSKNKVSWLDGHYL